jgi:hypothetical protein
MQKQWITAAMLTGVVVLGGCGKGKPADQAPAASPASAPAAAVPEKPRAVQRMEQPAYLAELKAIDAERKTVALEAAKIRMQMSDRAAAFEKESAAAAQTRQSITNLQQQIEIKQAAIQDLIKQDPAWQKLDAALQELNKQLDSVQDRARAVVMAKMKEQSAAHAAALATNAALRVVRPAQPLEGAKRMTNNLPFGVPAAMKAGVKP